MVHGISLPATRLQPDVHERGRFAAGDFYGHERHPTTGLLWESVGCPFEVAIAASKIEAVLHCDLRYLEKATRFQRADFYSRINIFDSEEGRKVRQQRGAFFVFSGHDLRDIRFNISDDVDRPLLLGKIK